MQPTWSLVQALAQEAGQRLPFYLPLASASPDASTVRLVGEDQFDPAMDRSDANDPRLRIAICPPAGGQFTNEGMLPDPAIRLHAIGAGKVWFRPAHGAYRDSLDLQFALLPLLKAGEVVAGRTIPPWWQRWIDAGCIPDRVVYENVDVDTLQEVLQALRAPIDTQDVNRVQPVHGLQFPPEVTETNRSQFVDAFFAGEDQCCLVAEPGAYLGVAAREDLSLQDPDDRRLLTLHARYHGPTESSPHPMSPLELFSLLFGNDSMEAVTHPLLRRLDAAGKAQSGHQSKSMRLRPPLRTHARLMWEADFETVDAEHPPDPPRTATPEAVENSPKWEPFGNIKDRLYNDYQGTDKNNKPRHFNRWEWNACPDKNGDVRGCWKCNLFVFDVALRAGFRVMLGEVGANLWHYQAPSGIAPQISTLRMFANGELLAKVPLETRIGIAALRVAWNIEGRLREVGSAGVMDEINRQIDQEGRCFAVVTAPHGSGSGHMVLVERIIESSWGKAVLTELPDHGFVSLYLIARGAGPYGAQRHNYLPTENTYSLIHLIELHPGQDPDTPRGLRDCNGLPVPK